MPLLQSAKANAEVARAKKHGPGVKEDSAAVDTGVVRPGAGEKPKEKSAEGHRSEVSEKGKKAAPEKHEEQHRAKHAVPKKEHKKEAKHAAPPSEPEQPEAEPQDDSEAGGDTGEPDAESEDTEQQGASDAARPAGGPPQDEAQGGGDSDQGDADAEGGQQQDNQPMGQQGAQGGAPVPDPNAPGAGDTTSGGADTPDDDAAQGSGDTGGGETPPTAQGPAAGGAGGIPQAQMTPALKEEYELLDQALNKALYQTPNDAIAGHVLQVLLPDGPHKVSSAIHICAVLMRELFTKTKGPPQLVLPFMRDVVAHVLQLGEQVKQVQYSEQELTAIMGGSLEAALKMFGVKKSHFDHVRNTVPRSVMGHHARNYQQLAKGSAGPAESPGPAAGAAGPQGPQGAPPQTPEQSSAASGPPPAAAMPPAGGALAQGAAAQGAQ